MSSPNGFIKTTYTNKCIFHLTIQLVCQLVWMFHSRGENNKKNRVREICLPITYNDKKSTFYELLEKDGSVSIHKRNLRFLTCEMLKLKRGIALELIKELILPNRQQV